MTDQRLTGHTAVVTGAANGIGRAIALRLAADGAAVAAVDLGDACETVKTIAEAGGRGQAFAADVSDLAAVDALAGAVTQSLGRVDVLVNNVGIYPNVPFAEADLALWRRVFAVNVESMFLTAKAFVPAMVERGRGRVINLTSNSIGLSFPNITHYIASKMAVIGLTRGLASEYGTAGVTVNAVAPSIVRTPGTALMPDELLEGLAMTQAIKRVEAPEDLTGTVAFLASDDAGFLTGQTIYVDGGLIRT